MPQVISNRTIDDQFGDSVSGLVPTYNPPSFWKVGASCGSGCAVHPDPTLAFNHTWHDSSQFPNEAPVSVSLQFTGTAVWVFCIAPPITENVITSYNLSFTLDNGAHTGTFSYAPTSSSDFLFNVPVVSLPTLANTAHTLVIATDDSVDGSIFLFDYAVYTSVEDDTPVEASKKPNTGTIAGCVFGGIFLLILVLALLRCRKRRRSRKPPVLPVIEPFPKNPAVDSGSTTLAPETTDLSRNPSTHSPSTLIHQLRQALDTAVAMGRTPASQSSPQSPSSGIRSHAFTSEDPHEPPPYQFRSSTSKS